VKTWRLIVMCLILGVAILVAFGLQVLLANR
jgi:hypothetical protein